jgi:hypothetical protein
LLHPFRVPILSNVVLFRAIQQIVPCSAGSVSH